LTKIGHAKLLTILYYYSYYYSFFDTVISLCMQLDKFSTFLLFHSPKIWDLLAWYAMHNTQTICK